MPSARNNAKREKAARAWREAKTGREAWARFRAYLAKHEDDVSDAPYWRTSMCGMDSWTGPSATRLLVFEKWHAINVFLPDNKGSDWGTRWKVATVSAPWAPKLFDVALIRHHAQMLKAPIGFVGDLDAHALHVFGALRSGDVDAPSLTGRTLSVKWLGVDDRWFARARRAKRAFANREISMGWVEREYWEIVKRMLPGVCDLIGEESSALLDAGTKIEIEGMSDILVDELRSRLKRDLPVPKRR
jgi:hypothetical protein